MEDLTLTEAQEKIMVDTWNQDPSNPPELSALTATVFGSPTPLDGRTKEARAVKKALLKHNLRGVKTTADYEAKTDKIELSEAHKLYITNNAKTMNAVEMAKIIFANPALTNLNAETRAVNDYMKGLDTTVVYSPEAVEDTPVGDYVPPKTIEQVLKRVNSYINFVSDRTKLTPMQTKCLKVLIGYLHTYRFIALMNNYQTNSDRKLCEDAVIRYTYDKPDLTQEEVDQYIELANQVVRANTVQRRQEHLEELLEQVTGNDPDTMKISMSLVEAIGKASTEYHQCEARKEKLFANLTQKRSARLDKQLKDNASVLNLIQVWRTEEGRTEWLKHAEREQAAVAKEVDHLTSLSELKARIFGLTKDEIKYG
jgi:hypothetical protein